MLADILANQIEQLGRESAASGGAFGILIDPDRWYSEHELRQRGLPFTEAAMRRARESGQLQCNEVARGQRVYKGEWLRTWLEGKNEKKGGEK